MGHFCITIAHCSASLPTAPDLCLPCPSAGPAVRGRGALQEPLQTRTRCKLVPAAFNVASLSGGVSIRLAALPARGAVGPQWLVMGVLPPANCAHSPQGRGGPALGRPWRRVRLAGPGAGVRVHIPDASLPRERSANTWAAAWGLPFGMYF